MFRMIIREKDSPVCNGLHPTLPYHTSKSKQSVRVLIHRLNDADVLFSKFGHHFIRRKGL